MYGGSGSIFGVVTVGVGAGVAVDLVDVKGTRGGNPGKGGLLLGTGGLSPGNGGTPVGGGIRLVLVVCVIGLLGGKPGNGGLLGTLGGKPEKGGLFRGNCGTPVGGGIMVVCVLVLVTDGSGGGGIISNGGKVGTGV